MVEASASSSVSTRRRIRCFADPFVGSGALSDLSPVASAFGSVSLRLMLPVLFEMRVAGGVWM